MAGYPQYGAPGPAETASHALYPGDSWGYGAEPSPGDSYASSYPGHESQYGSAGPSSGTAAAPAASNTHDYGWFPSHGNESHATAPPAGHPPPHDMSHPPPHDARHPPPQKGPHVPAHPPSRLPPQPQHMETAQQKPAPWNQPSHPAQEYNLGSKGTPVSSSMPVSAGSSSYPPYGATESRSARYYGQPGGYSAENSRPPATAGAPPAVVPGQKSVAPPLHGADTRPYSRAAAPQQSNVPTSRIALPPSHSAPVVAERAPATSQSGAPTGAGGEPYSQRSSSTSAAYDAPRTSFRGGIYDFGNSPLRRTHQSYPAEKPKPRGEQQPWRAGEPVADDGREREGRAPVRSPAAQAATGSSGRPSGSAYGSGGAVAEPPPASHRLPPSAAHRAPSPVQQRAHAEPPHTAARVAEVQDAASRNAVRSSLLQKLAAGAGDQVGLTGAQIDQVVQVVKLLNSSTAADGDVPQPSTKPESTARYADKAPIETDVASPDYGVSLVYTKGTPPPLVPVPAHLRKVAECGDYLHFHHLMFNAMHPPGAVKVAQEEAKHKGNKDVLLTDGIASIKGIDAWLLAWSRFARCYLDKHPQRAMELIRYQCFIVEMSACYSTPAWLSYDAAFRQLQTRQRDVRWDRPDPELFRIWFTAERRRTHPVDSDLQQATPQVVDALPMPPGVAFPYLSVLPPPIAGFPSLIGLPGVPLAPQAGLGMLSSKPKDLPAQSYKAFTAVPSSSPAKVASSSSTPSTQSPMAITVSSSSSNNSRSSSSSSSSHLVSASTRTQTSPSGKNPVSSPMVRKSASSASSDDKWKPVGRPAPAGTSAGERPADRSPYSNKSAGGGRHPPAVDNGRGNPSHRGHLSRSSGSASGSEHRSYVADSSQKSSRSEDSRDLRPGSSPHPYWTGRR